MRLHSVMVPLALLAAGSAPAATFVEAFEAPFPAWESAWFGTQSDALNYYCPDRGCTDRGNNPDGLWLRGVNGSNGEIVVTFAAGFAQGIESLSIDVAGFATTTLRAYDVDGALIFAQAVTLTGGAFSDPGVYANYHIASTNGISRFGFDGGAAGNTSIDNIAVNVVPEPGTYALMAVGLAAVAGWARRRQTAG